ncbi:MAG: hypothetical protein HGA98_02810 [Deltaproteobacteria bacterium]|nr:hypothetical protein [Deltaproteobacteria bacterium]
MTGVEAEPYAAFGERPGVRVEVFDESKTYGYSNLFQVKLRVVALFAGSDERYERTLEKLGVLDHDVARVRDELLAGFEARALPYLSRSDFAEKLADRRRQEQRTVVRFPVPG